MLTAGAQAKGLKKPEKMQVLSLQSGLVWGINIPTIIRIYTMRYRLYRTISCTWNNE